MLPSADLVVTHAGWQTINAALADGVPLVCIPDGRDQPDNAVRVAHVGAGVRARKSTPPQKLRAIIETSLADPALKRGAQSMASALARSNGTTTTADAIEALVNARASGSTASAMSVYSHARCYHFDPAAFDRIWTDDRSALASTTRRGVSR